MAQKGERTGVYVNCEYCGKLVYKTQTNYNRRKHHYCSNECQLKKQAEYNRVDRICPICGNTFNVIRSSPKIYCSNACVCESNHLKNTLNPKPTKKIPYKCDWCGEDILIKPSRLKASKYHFCNEVCRKEWFAKIYSQSEYFREFSRENATKVLNNNAPFLNSKPQQIINSLLSQLNITYHNEKKMKYYSLDNYLPDYNLAIEVMGDYWHGSPIKYSDENLNKMQLRTVKRDKAKNRYIVEGCSIEILYLWETDIIKNIELCKKLIELYLKNKGQLENYHSFNYTLLNEEILVNKNIIQPIFETI